MTIGQFIKKTDLSEKSELEKVKYVGFFLLKEKKNSDFTVSELSQLFSDVGFSKPNSSRLTDKIKKSRDFIKGTRNNSFTLHFKINSELETELPLLGEKSEEVIAFDTILPESLFQGTRGYIEKLCKQINASFENNIFDGAAVLMRRLMEVLLVQGYDHQNRLAEIKDGNDLKNLNTIINYTVSNNVFSLSKGTKECLDIFRKLGNFSAHRIQYNCRKTELKKVAMEYRVAIEELLYASGLK
ncbi:MAG: hypothetical protein COC16_02010 [Lutibacter sp.]|nr:MAG: hypothetical protein COC16_02010 [Lutibacter sp.]